MIAGAGRNALEASTGLGPDVRERGTGNMALVGITGRLLRSAFAAAPKGEQGNA